MQGQDPEPEDLVIEPGKGSWTLETEPGAVMDGTTVEHIVDAARVLGRYADVLGLRSFPRGEDWSVARQDQLLRNFAKYCEKPVINLESARRHPCQELADALTLRESLGETRGKRFVLNWAWHPKALPTAVPVNVAFAICPGLGMFSVTAEPPVPSLARDHPRDANHQEQQQAGKDEPLRPARDAIVPGVEVGVVVLAAHLEQVRVVGEQHRRHPRPAELVDDRVLPHLDRPPRPPEEVERTAQQVVAGRDARQ